MRIPSPVRCILFDAVGTLICADPPVSAVYATAAGDYGISLDEELVRRRFVDAFVANHCQNDNSQEHRTSQAREVDRWRSIVASVFPELAPCEPLFQSLWDHFARPSSWRVYTDVAACWLRLAGSGLKLGVASNFDDRLARICRELPPLDRSHHVFISSRLGFRKPSVQFFRAIESAMKLSPHELLLIGDDRENDFLAAQSAGWHAIYLDRSSVEASQRSIRSLADLP